MKEQEKLFLFTEDQRSLNQHKRIVAVAAELCAFANEPNPGFISLFRIAGTPTTSIAIDARAEIHCLLPAKCIFDISFFQNSGSECLITGDDGVINIINFVQCPPVRLFSFDYHTSYPGIIEPLQKLRWNLFDSGNFLAFSSQMIAVIIRTKNLQLPISCKLIKLEGILEVEFLSYTSSHILALTERDHSVHVINWQTSKEFPEEVSLIKIDFWPCSLFASGGFCTPKGKMVDVLDHILLLGEEEARLQDAGKGELLDSCKFLPGKGFRHKYNFFNGILCCLQPETGDLRIIECKRSTESSLFVKDSTFIYYLEEICNTTLHLDNPIWEFHPLVERDSNGELRVSILIFDQTAINLHRILPEKRLKILQFTSDNPEETKEEFQKKQQLVMDKLKEIASQLDEKQGTTEPPKKAKEKLPVQDCEFQIDNPKMEFPPELVSASVAVGFRDGIINSFSVLDLFDVQSRINSTQSKLRYEMKKKEKQIALKTEVYLSSINRIMKSCDSMINYFSEVQESVISSTHSLLNLPATESAESSTNHETSSELMGEFGKKATDILEGLKNCKNDPTILLNLLESIHQLGVIRLAKDFREIAVDICKELLLLNQSVQHSQIQNLIEKMGEEISHALLNQVA